MIGHFVAFKIGITGRLAFDDQGKNRWNEDKYGYCWDGWLKMILLYASPNAHKCIHDGSGRMEDDLIKVFGHLPECENETGGGGGATRTKPHFTYLVVRICPSVRMTPKTSEVRGHMSLIA